MGGQKPLADVLEPQAGAMRGAVAESGVRDPDHGKPVFGRSGDIDPPAFDLGLEAMLYGILDQRLEKHWRKRGCCKLVWQFQ